MSLFALVDCNSFYCSCERVFHPETRGRPVIVLSNNDGCAIAFTKEAKAIGFGEMCEPFYKIQERIRKHNVAVFSSNYTLYDDMSKRVMKILGSYTPDLEVYSIDEAFLSLEGFGNYDLLAYGRKIRKDLLQQTGIPVGVGIARTKVLAKVANKMAKKNTGVYMLTEEEEINRVLKAFPVKDLWGIGSASARKLLMLGIKSAYEFKIYKDEKLIQRLLTKTGREVQEELRGVSCLPLEEVEDKKNIATTRSFGCDVYDRKDLKEALADFCTKASEKLRYQDSVCFSINVFIHTNRFKDFGQYYGAGTFVFQTGTSDTIKLIKAAHKVLDEIYRPGFGYKKGGVILNQIVPRSENQIDLFNPDPSDNLALNQTIDMINKKFGPKTVKSAACGIQQKWKLNADYISRRFTTDWDELLAI